LQAHNLAEDFSSQCFADNKLFFNGFLPNSYHASAICNYIRDQLLLSRQSFSFETVMSHESKIHFLRDAQKMGYRTYLYFVATETPDINVVRVQERVEKGGHPVPEDKIRSRYERSINLLYDAIGFANRAYIFDNSHEQHEPILIAEYNGKELIARVDAIPYWFVETWNRF
jgi:predicted ABC-type ATPase